MRWTKEQESFLTKTYPDYGGEYCAQKLGLSWRQVNSKAQILGVKININPCSKTRVCKKCWKNKHISRFPRDKKNPMGVSTWCKLCFRRRNLVNYYKDITKSRLKWQQYSHQKYLREKINQSPNLVIQRLRHRTRRALQGIGKTASTLELLGCSKCQFVKYIKSKLGKDMTWEDVMSGKIHLDHVKPCSSFDFTNPVEQRKCFHYTNIQPLWSRDNIKKGKTWIASSDLGN